MRSISETGVLFRMLFNSDISLFYGCLVGMTYEETTFSNGIFYVAFGSIVRLVSAFEKCGFNPVYYKSESHFLLRPDYYVMTS